LPRHALHAAGISFEHPLTDKKVEFNSPLPEDLQSFLNGEPVVLPGDEIISIADFDEELSDTAPLTGFDDVSVEINQINP